MEQLMAEQLRSLGPWVIAAVALIFYRKEITAALFAPRGDRAVEKLLSDQNNNFAKNLVYFEKSTKDTEAILSVSKEILEVQRDIYTEMVRGQGK
jgi:hypothetical protein